MRKEPHHAYKGADFEHEVVRAVELSLRTAEGDGIYGDLGPAVVLPVAVGVMIDPLRYRKLRDGFSLGYAHVDA